MYQLSEASAFCLHSKCKIAGQRSPEGKKCLMGAFNNDPEAGPLRLGYQNN